MIKCIIVDDEPNAVNLLNQLVADATNWEVVALCYNGLEALKLIKTNQVQFVFIDINMPGLNGMELAALLPKTVKIVFTTAYSTYAVDSYLLGAIDYVLKPITLKRFLIVQEKIEAHFLNPSAYLMVPAAAPQEEYLFVKSGKSVHKIMLCDLLYVSGEKEYIRIVTRKENLLVYRRLKEMEQQLTDPFIRVHNSYIINMENMDKFADNHVFIGGERIPVSNKYRSHFMAQLYKKSF
jgi:two-component system LytT family response regulator